MFASGIPVKIPTPWASGAGAGFIRQVPTSSQIGLQAGAASFTDGFPPVTFLPVAGGGTPPFGQDFNGALNQITSWNRWQQAGGAVLYDVNFAISAAVNGYPKGAILSSTTLGNFWLNNVDNNQTNPDAGAANFTASISGTVMTVTAVALGTLALGQVIAGSGVTAGSVIIAFGSGNGGNGTYTLNNSQTVGSEAMTATGAANWTGFSLPAITAGGFVNKDRNSSLDIWGRGTSGTVNAGAANYTADGLILGATGSSAGWSRGAGLGLTAYSMTISGSAGLTDVFVKKRIESFMAAQNAGVNVTVQAKVKNNSGATITPTLTAKHLNASDAGVTTPWAGASTTDVSAANLQQIANGATVVVAYTYAAPAGAANGTEFTWDFGGALNNVNNIQISEFDMRATPFVAVGINNQPPLVELRPISIEQPICGRYLPGFAPVGGSASSGSGNTVGVGSIQDDTIGNADIYIIFPVPARVDPTGATVSSSAHFEQTLTGAVLAISACVFNGAGTKGGNVKTTYAANSYGGASGANKSTLLWAKNPAASIIFTGCEL